MMRFKDFPIAKKENKYLPNDQEDVGETLLRINNWVEENEHIVLNIETLFFPELHKNKRGTGARYYKFSGQSSTVLNYQVFRAWYKESKPITNIEVGQLV